jgi:hypothetical protein
VVSFEKGAVAPSERESERKRNNTKHPVFSMSMWQYDENDFSEELEDKHRTHCK